MRKLVRSVRAAGRVITLVAGLIGLIQVIREGMKAAEGRVLKPQLREGINALKQHLLRKKAETGESKAM